MMPALALTGEVHDVEQPEMSCCLVRCLVRDAVQFAEHDAGAKAIRIVTDVPAALQVNVQRELFTWALCRLLRRAVDASPHGGEVVVTAVDTGSGIDVEIADNGAGLLQGPRASLSGLTEIDVHGATVSLAWIDHVARRHGGRSFVMNCPDGGAAYTLRIAKLGAGGGRARAA